MFHVLIYMLEFWSLIDSLVQRIHVLCWSNLLKRRVSYKVPLTILMIIRRPNQWCLVNINREKQIAGYLSIASVNLSWLFLLAPFLCRIWSPVIWLWMKTVSSRWEIVDLKQDSLWFRQSCGVTGVQSCMLVPHLTLSTNSDPGLWFGTAHRWWNDGLRSHPVVPSPGNHAQLDALQHDRYAQI